MAVKGQASQTIVDLTDGFSVSLSQDSASWNGNDTKLGTAQTVSITVSAYQGASVAPSFSVGEAIVSDTTNCQAPVSGTTVNVTVGANATTGGTVTIPVTINSNGSSVIINKTFSYSIALKGQGGATGVSMRNKGAWTSGTSYTAGTSGGTYIDVVTLNGSSYACKSSHTSSNSNKPPNSTYWTLLSEKGEQGEQGIQGVPGPQGPQGEEGDPAIMVVVTGDTVLRNNTGSTWLYASVYVGGAPATINETTGVVTYNGTNIGTIKWYKGATSGTGSAAGKYQIGAGDVTNSLVVYAQLEG